MKKNDYSLQAIMGAYFASCDDNSDGAVLLESSFLQNFNPHFDRSPVRIASSDWEVVDSPQRLMKKFKFDDTHSLKAFVVELLDFQDQVAHHGKITIQTDEVITEIYTHLIDAVTEADKEWAEMADSIYEDIKYLSPPTCDENETFK